MFASKGVLARKLIKPELYRSHAPRRNAVRDAPASNCGWFWMSGDGNDRKWNLIQLVQGIKKTRHDCIGRFQDL